LATAKSDLGQTRNPAGTWDAVSLEQRRTICDWWVLDVLISVEPLEGRKRANQEVGDRDASRRAERPARNPHGRGRTRTYDLTDVKNRPAFWTQPT
jgi:hypothetical protein